MLKELLKFELRYHIKKISFLTMSILSTLAGIQSYRKLNFNPDLVFNNSPYHLSLSIIVFSLIAIFVSLYFTINSVLRDHISKFEDIIFSSSITKKHYYLARYLGVLTSTTIIYCFFLLGLLFTEIFIDTNTAPSNGSIYVWGWFIFVIPNLFIIISINFAIASYFRSVFNSYIGSIVLFIIYWVCSLLSGSPLTGTTMMTTDSSMLNILCLLDPLGLTAFFEQSQFWTILEKNTVLINFSGSLLWNRVLWLGLTSILLLSAYSYFTFKISPVHAKKLKDPDKIVFNTTYFTVPTNTSSNSFYLKTLYSQLKIGVKTIIFHRPFLLLMLCWAVLNFLVNYFMLEGTNLYGKKYPTASFLIGNIPRRTSFFLFGNHYFLQW